MKPLVRIIRDEACLNPGRIEIKDADGAKEEPHKKTELNALRGEEAKVMRNKLDPADSNDLREQTEALTDRIIALETARTRKP